MSKAPKRLTPAALAVMLCAVAAAAQVGTVNDEAADTWVTVHPAGEAFGALMSKQPVSVEQRAGGGGLYAEGRRYAAAADERTTFVVWSLKETAGAWRRLSAADTSADGVGAASLYLDGVAELAWELLVTPDLERLRRQPDGRTRAAELGIGMSFVREFNVSGRPAREYLVQLEKERGPVYVTADGARVYVVAGLGENARDPRLKLFANSFTVGDAPRESRDSSGPNFPSIPTDPHLFKADPREPARGNTGGGDAPADSGKPSRQVGVARKAVITFKPEPGFTEEARRFNVAGVVRLRAILASSGEVKSVTVVKALPHGLTRNALDAALRVRFEPAQMDGRAVSQYVVLEYNFNIY
ncbi:MAG TPA: energy transducer TonB [Pyrinomonadaceae bacterium]|jgi:TonB family protein